MTGNIIGGVDYGDFERFWELRVKSKTRERAVIGYFTGSATQATALKNKWEDRLGKEVECDALWSLQFKAPIAHLFEGIPELAV